jgi:Zn-dependent metalloprotease
MENINKLQRKTLERLMKRDKGASVRWNDDRGVASVLRGRLVPPSRVRKHLKNNPEAVLKAFLEELGPLVGPKDSIDSMRFVTAKEAKGDQVRIRAMQVAKGIPIHGASLVLHADAERGVFRAQSGGYRDIKVPPLKYRGKRVDVAQRERKLRRRLMRTLRDDKQGAKFIDRKMETGFGDDDVAEKNFPLNAPPVHWLYPWKGKFRHVFRLYAYQPTEWLGVNGEMTQSIHMMDMAVDLRTGRKLYQGGPIGVWSDVTADGRSTLQQGGSYITRTLLAVREDMAERLLVNRTNSTDIFTHHAGGSDSGLETKLQNGTDLSTDTDGHWNDTTTSCTASDREDSQQPETDGHFFAQEAYQYYDALGWEGFDNGEWGTAPCDVRVAAHIGINDNAYFWRWVDGSGRHFGYLAFYDGECSGGSVVMDFMAGDPGIFAHEYQHAVTYFGSVDSAGDPGYLEITGWHRAIHEGLSDSAAGLRTEIWTAPGLWPDGVCRNNLPFRRMEYPRSTDTKSGSAYVDHYDDRVGAGSPYTNSTILSHALFLAGQGGVHERTSRAAELIPVPGAGNANIFAIMHDAVTDRFDSIPANSTGVQTMIEVANLILDAAEDAAGDTRSCEYVMLRRAFYAVGLYPFDSSYVKQSYGGEACMLPWTISWKHSQPYLGFPAHWWRSPDLFINNGSGVEYDADVGAENDLFARVRNIGDADLSSVVVRFYFRAHGTALPPSSTAWKPCQDSAATDCVLTIPTLAAGSMNFTNPASPPASQAVKWYLPASEVVAGVDHFCVRAEIECAGAANHDNDCPYRAQSNVSYTPLSATNGLDIRFIVANWEKEPAPLDLEIDDRSLPEGVRLRFKGPGSLKDRQLKPGEEVALRWKVEAPEKVADWLRPPFDGSVVGRLRGRAKKWDRFDAELSDVQTRKPRKPRRGIVSIEGFLAGHLRRKGRKLQGRFKGELNTKDGTLTGVWTSVRYRKRVRPYHIKLKVKAVLRPTRAIHFAQRVRGELVGGVTYALRWPDKERPN